MTGHRLFWPSAALIALLLGNLVVSPRFFAVEIRDGHLYGNLIDILRNGSPLILIAVGMTLVIATRGIDLSVGAVVAVSGAVACVQLAGANVVVSVALALGLCLVLGAWNGWLVAGLKIQPIVATLILMVAGRGLAQLITGGQIVTVTNGPFLAIAGGYLLTLPLSFLIAMAVYALTSLIVRRSALGMVLESVGGNPEASRLSGLRSGRLIWLCYVFSGLCAGVAGLIISSNVTGADGNNAGLWIELDAILAVVIGGTQLTGGRFSLGGTVIGALLIQTLTTTVYALGIPSQETLLFKAVVVTVVCLVQSPAFRAKLAGRRRRPRPTAVQTRSDQVEVAS
ncbi:ABC transporter permease [Kutzneria sp. 744]|uniref:ABC transporter permease n=1 Tax=Kutzneria sp. (strain 744) TaxID=345341 RepID=UPI0003EEA533|nr:ABC transporter permease [Kutzneria sp. 744]EWM09967.1 simple sugar transporter permease [Kutzneria sp. 744]